MNKEIQTFDKTREIVEKALEATGINTERILETWKEIVEIES